MLSSRNILLHLFYILVIFGYIVIKLRVYDEQIGVLNAIKCHTVKNIYLMWWILT